jgi:hypothetical protein
MNLGDVVDYIELLFCPWQICWKWETPSFALVFGWVAMLTLTLHKALVQKRYARSISGHQETLVHFQDLTVCLIPFHP